jgi:hypothetical protein
MLASYMIASILILSIYVSSARSLSELSDESDAGSIQSKKFNSLLKLLIDSAVKNRIEELRQEAAVAREYSKLGEDDDVKLSDIIKKYQHQKFKQNKQFGK